LWYPLEEGWRRAHHKISNKTLKDYLIVDVSCGLGLISLQPISANQTHCAEKEGKVKSQLLFQTAGNG